LQAIVSLTLFIFQDFCVSSVDLDSMFYSGVQRSLSQPISVFMRWPAFCRGSRSCSASFYHFDWFRLGRYHRTFNRLCHDYLFFYCYMKCKSDFWTVYDVWFARM